MLAINDLIFQFTYDIPNDIFHTFIQTILFVNDTKVETNQNSLMLLILLISQGLIKEQTNLRIQRIDEIRNKRI